MHTNWQVALKITDEGNTSEITRCLRKVISNPVSEVATALKEGQPVPICTLFTKHHDQDEKVLLGLIAELEHIGTTVEIHISGKVESKQYLKNILQRHRETAYDIQIETELELGEDTEESRAWAAGRARYPQGDA